MKKTPAISRVALGVVALIVALAGCGSSNKPAASSSSSSSSSSSPTSATSSPAAAPTIPSSPTTAAGPNPTIATYIKDNGIQETPVHKGDPGTPTINDPVPDGWQGAGADTPDWAYSTIVFPGPAPDIDQYKPNIETILSKLTGNVDPQKILDVAGGEVNNLPGYKVMDAGSPSTMGNFPGYQLDGTWNDNGQTEVVAQKTVVIQAPGGVYVLQINAHSLESQQDILSAATKVINDQTTITV
jgi:hypothetical protein